MFGCTEKIRRVANPICVVNKNIRHIVARRAPNACYLRSKRPDGAQRTFYATLQFVLAPGHSFAIETSKDLRNVLILKGMLEVVPAKS